MSNKVTIRVCLTAGTYAAATRAYLRCSPRLLLRGVAGAVFIAAGVSLLPLLYADFGWLPTLLIAVITLLLTGVQVGYTEPRKRFHKDPRAGGDQTFVFADDAVYYRGADAESRVGWEFFTRVVETDELYLLEHNQNGMFTALPKSAFASASDEQAFRRMARRTRTAELRDRMEDAGTTNDVGAAIGAPPEPYSWS